MSNYLIHLRPSFIRLLKVVRIIFDWILDVHNALAQFFPLTTFSYEFIRSIDSSITSIIIPNWTCNDKDYTIFDFSRFSIVESIEIGDDCFGSVQTFQIDGLNRLKTIKIGNKSFTNKKNWYGKNESKSFHILNCESLEYSFSDFGGEFELKNLPQLQSIQIGTIERRRYFIIGSESNNFYNSSFVIRGIELIWYWIIEWLDLPNLQSITLGNSAFHDSLSTIIESIEWIRMKWFE